jgi:hypothetical protein
MLASAATLLVATAVSQVISRIRILLESPAKNSLSCFHALDDSISVLERSHSCEIVFTSQYARYERFQFRLFLFHLSSNVLKTYQFD